MIVLLNKCTKQQKLEISAVIFCWAAHSCSRPGSSILLCEGVLFQWWRWHLGGWSWQQLEMSIEGSLSSHFTFRKVWVFEAGEIHCRSNEVWTTGGYVTSHGVHRICMERRRKINVSGNYRVKLSTSTSLYIWHALINLHALCHHTLQQCNGYVEYWKSKWLITSYPQLFPT